MKFDFSWNMIWRELGKEQLEYVYQNKGTYKVDKK